MSTDTIALFDIHERDATPERLYATLAADPGFAAELIERYRHLWTISAWMLTSTPTTDEPELLGPGGFALRWRGSMLELYHMMPFGRFTGDVWHRQALRQACRRIASLVGSTHVLYTHELMPHEGADVQAITDWLHAHIGPPALDFSDLHAADYFGPRAWYIEKLDEGDTSPDE